MKTCGVCGGPKSFTGRKKRWAYCRPCALEKLRARRGTGIVLQPVPTSGARERLARLLDERWNEVLPRLADLMGRSIAFGVSTREEQRA